MHGAIELPMSKDALPPPDPLLCLCGAGTPRFRRRLHRGVVAGLSDRPRARPARGRHRSYLSAFRVSADDFGRRLPRRPRRPAPLVDRRLWPHGRHRPGVCGFQHLCSRVVGGADWHHQSLGGQRQHLRPTRACGPCRARSPMPNAQKCLRATAWSVHSRRRSERSPQVALTF